MKLAQLEDAISALTDNAPPFVGGAPLRASWAGACARQIAYRLRAEPPSEDLAAQSRIAFAVGSGVHWVVQSALSVLYPDGVAEAEGRLVIDDEEHVIAVPVDWPVGPFAEIGCHADFAYGRVVVEIKTMQPYAFDRSADEGPQAHHLLQAGLNGLAQDANVVEMVYIDKAKGRIRIFECGAALWRDQATEEARRLAAVFAAHRAGRLPHPIDEQRKVWQCRYCPFLTTCKTGARQEVLSDADPF